jgi:hypothetical protein
MAIGTHKDFWAATSILIAIAVTMIAVVLQYVRIGFLVGPFRLNHWLVLIGTVYIAVAVPAIALLKKRHPQRYASLLRTHTIGNLLAFALISLHFASQISRPAASYPELGTGLALYTAKILLVGTGYLQRFWPVSGIRPEAIRFVHASSAFALYLIIVVHILHGLAIL